MAIGANSYGDPDHVAKLVPQHANSAGRFDDATVPSLATVEAEIDQVSGLMNVLLLTEGFDVPITQPDVKLLLDGFVNKTVAEIVKAIRGGGRFGPGVKEGRKTLTGYVLAEIADFIEGMADGMEAAGASRGHSVITGISYRSEDNRGIATPPIFQRAQFGDTFKDDLDS